MSAGRNREADVRSWGGGKGQGSGRRRSIKTFVLAACKLAQSLSMVTCQASMSQIVTEGHQAGLADRIAKADARSTVRTWATFSRDPSAYDVVRAPL